MQELELELKGLEDVVARKVLERLLTSISQFLKVAKGNLKAVEAEGTAVVMEDVLM